MRIIQIIDSLDIGGAEKMAINYANSLAKSTEFSGIVATRKEGELKKNINEEVSYLFLNKNKTLDIKAVLHLKKYCKKNKVNCIQAHSSSFFIAFMVKLLLPKIKIIWHIHSVIFSNSSRNKKYLIQLFSLFFKGIITVNSELEEWAKNKLYCKNVIYLQNFIIENENYLKETILKGNNGNRVLYLANLRDPKNHLMLVEVVNAIHIDFPSWTFHLVGTDFMDVYSEAIKKKIEEYQLQNVIFLYGSKTDIENIIMQSDIGVITSNSEGLSVSLIEYGFYEKPVVVTNVGQTPFVVDHNVSGYVSEPQDIIAFSEYLSMLLKDENLRIKFGKVLLNTITENYTETVVINKYISWVSQFK
jgi:glycosyltransferase involved in cell wall biosynthesis